MIKISPLKMVPLALGCVALALNLSLLHPARADGFIYTGTLHTAHTAAASVLLTNGLVLVAGGLDNGVAELYNPVTQTWALTGSLNEARGYATLTVLSNGLVLAAGGEGSGGDVLASAELYNPVTGTWTLTGVMNAERSGPTATLLPDGQVLVAGGYNYESGDQAGAELYNPATGTWTLTGSMNSARCYHTATLLPNGRVLVVGGQAASGYENTVTELYNPATGTWAEIGSLNTARELHTATLLPDGEVLVAGGFNNGGSISTAELLNLSTGAWTLTGSLNTSRGFHTATLLPNGLVVAIGGDNYPAGPLAGAELYHPASGTWETIVSLNTARFDHTANLLPNGKVLVAGGYGSGGFGDPLSSAELFVPSGPMITTVAGKYGLGGTYSGDGGAATNAGLWWPETLALDSQGDIYIADSDNSVIRKVTGGHISTVAGKSSLAGGYSGDGGAATSAALSYACGVAVDSSGQIYIADSGNNVIRKVDTNGIITTVAGDYSQGGGYAGDGSAATNAALSYPTSVAVDQSGQIYIADVNNNVIRKVDTLGIITTVAGNYSLGAGPNGVYTGDGGPATSAGLCWPMGLAVDSEGQIYIADSLNGVIRKVDASGTITTVAGNYVLSGDGTGAYSGDGGPATDACLDYPCDVKVDSSGDLFIADTYNNVIRQVDGSGTITTVVGDYIQPGTYSGDGGVPTEAGLNAPYGVALDVWGDVFIADSYNNVIRKVTNY